MTYRRLPRNFPDLLRAAGLTVVEIHGWQDRGRPASTGNYDPVGHLNHHTGSPDVIGDPRNDKAYCEGILVHGRSDLPGPLVQTALSMEGVVYVIASGRCNHAGKAKPSGSVAGGDGNALYSGTEWMLSGTQAIPDKMMRAGAILNAVILRIYGSSVQAVSCHYQTSVTGKWDIGDPHGLPFHGHRVLDVPKFRRMVQVEKDRLAGQARPAAAPAKHHLTLKFQHSSMEFSDTAKEKASDVERLFERGHRLGIHILTGTEAYSGPLTTLLPAAARKYGYHFFKPEGEWIAIKDTLLGRVPRWDQGWIPCIKSSEGVGVHSPRGVSWVSFNAHDLGRITVGVGHYLVKGRNPGDPNHHLNVRLASTIGTWARQHGAGSGLVFYAGDQNIPDNYQDTFFGQPLTSFWDALDKHEFTGHGNIDVIASYDNDGRVKPTYINAYNDTEFALNTDHFLVDATASVEVL